MPKVSVSDVLEMTIDERILFVEDVWDTIAEIPDAVPLTEAQRKELDSRLESYHQNQNLGSPWEAVKARVQGRRNG
jgi:putative addiction module component (TIGR02574 family)